MRTTAFLAFAALLPLLAAPRAAAQDDPAALVAQLGSDDAQTRSDAYTKLLRARSPEAMALLSKALPTLPLAGQLYAVYVLEGYQGNDALAMWKKLSDQGGAFVQAAAGAALWRRGDKGAAVVLAAAILAAPPAERSHVLGRLHGIEDPLVVVAVRRLVRADVEPAVLGDALFHLLQWDRGRIVETATAIEPLLAGPEAAAAIGLLYLVAAGDGQRHAEALAAAIRDDRLPQHQVTRFLERAARLDAVVLDAIVLRLERTKVEYDVTRFVQLLQKHGPQRIEAALRGHLDGGDSKLRGAALKALASVPGALDKKKFAEMLASQDRQVVLLAADTLRRMDDHAGLPAVLAMVATAGSDRAEVVRVLGGFRDRRVIPPLLDAAGAAEVAVRRSAVTALQQLLPDLFPYRRFDLERAGCRADGPEAQRTEGLRLLRAWWDAQQPK